MIDRYVKCNLPECDRNAHYTGKGRRGYCAIHDRRIRVYGDPRGGRTIPGEPMAFLDKFVASEHDTDECIIWPYAKNSAGYGHLIVDRRHTLVSRIICEKFHGPAPDDAFAAHSCGNGHLSCMNPNHIRWATPKENTQDRRMHGTFLMGETIPWSKLTEADVVAIRSAPGFNREIAEQYGVSTGTIQAVKSGKTWRHVS